MNPVRSGGHGGNTARQAKGADTVLRLRHSRPRFLLHSSALMGIMALLAGATPGHAAYPTSGTIDGGATVTVPDDGPTNYWNPSNLSVGYSSTGTLIIQNGGTVGSSGTAYIGRSAGTQGSVTVSGSGSQWTYNNRLYIGSLGKGSLEILAGGTVVNISTITDYIGYGGGSTGFVTVSGTGSTWTTPAFVVGESGNGTLTIADHGIVHTSTTVLVA